MRRHHAGLVALVSLVLETTRADAAAVDGRIDPEYGAPRSVQTTQTSLGENSFYASELDQAFAFIAGNTLHLLLAGTFNRFFSEPLILPHSLQIFIDAGPGGQNVLEGTNPSVGASVTLATMTGLAFDADFTPDYWLEAGRQTGGADPLFAYYAELPAGGAGAGYFLGRSAEGGPGTLSGAGAFNPFGILASFDPSNIAGVSGGCDASSGAGVETGIEWAIPLAALGNPTGTLRICALLATPGVGVSNQVLGPVPPGTCALGPPSGVSFANVAGAQYFEIDITTPVMPATWGRLKAGYR